MRRARGNDVASSEATRDIFPFTRPAQFPRKIASEIAGFGRDLADRGACFSFFRRSAGMRALDRTTGFFSPPRLLYGTTSRASRHARRFFFRFFSFPPSPRELARVAGAGALAGEGPRVAGSGARRSQCSALAKVEGQAQDTCQVSLFV